MVIVVAPPDPDPQPYCPDYPSVEAYEQAWHIWRARQRDGRLNSEETAAQWAVVEDALRSRLRG